MSRQALPSTTRDRDTSQYVAAFALADRLVTNAEYLDLHE